MSVEYPKVFLQFLVTEPALETVGIVRWPVAGVSCSCNCTFSAHVHTRIQVTGIGYTRTVFPVMPVTFRSNAWPRCCVCASHTVRHGFWSLLFVTIFFVQHREINSNAKLPIVSVAAVVRIVVRRYLERTRSSIL